MNPSLTNISNEDNNTLKFTLSGVNVSLANALRRTILSDIPIVAIYTQTYEDNDCNIEINTSRLHNEILKQRLSSIPVHITDLNVLPGNYLLDVDVKNDTDTLMYVTTEHFKIKNKENGNYLSNEETKKIFPMNAKTNMYIDFGRLRPGIGDQIPGEHIKLTAEFSVHAAKEDGMFNVASKCAYGNTPDLVKANEVWQKKEDSMRGENGTNDEISFEKKNFYLLDAQRSFVDDSFDFVIQSVGVYDNKDLVLKGCQALENKLNEMVQSLDSDLVPILRSETTMDNCYDIVLENEDYTIGKSLEYILYEEYYQTEKLSFCGFKKFHPHDDNSKIRLAGDAAFDKQVASQYVREACIKAIQVFRGVYNMMK
uniref:DNA-directed RNA polymerase RpoA/D/Rpb3-type domain-containing protein n=1 Tax=viral metagenome TaxID=1070528 RepID=A0A6C0IMU0_9ZZZZ